MLTLGGKPLQVPILQGGMGVGVSLGGLAGAVAACGGMGCISTADAGYRETGFARDPAAANHRALTAEIQKGRKPLPKAWVCGHQRHGSHPGLCRRHPHRRGGGVDAVVSVPGLPLELPGIVGTKAGHCAHRIQRPGGLKLIPAPLGKGL